MDLDKAIGHFAIYVPNPKAELLSEEFYWVLNTVVLIELARVTPLLVGDLLYHASFLEFLQSFQVLIFSWKFKVEFKTELTFILENDVYAVRIVTLRNKTIS